MWIRYVRILTVIALFVFAQVGVVTHEVSHLKTATNQSQPDKNTTTEHCAQCLAYAQVDGALPSIAIHVAMDASVYFISTAYVAYLLAVISRAYQARAPPSLI